jgi:hypothetical protein
MGVQRHAPAALPPEKTRPLYRSLVGPQGRSGRVRKSSLRTVQAVASRTTEFHHKWNFIPCGVCLAPCRNTRCLHARNFGLCSLQVEGWMSPRGNYRQEDTPLGL